MPRPKKAPRDRLQITLPKPIAKKLRAFAKSKDAELSAVVGEALSAYFRTVSRVPETLANGFEKTGMVPHS